MAEFQFLRPEWLLALLPLVAGLILASRRRPRGWEDVVDPGLRPHVIREGGSGSRGGLVLAGLAGLLAVLALAGPSVVREDAGLLEDASGLVVVLDLSRSMQSTDLQPDRITRARFKLDALLERRRSGRTGLVVFAGQAFVVTPLTRDIRTITALAGELEPAIMPARGSRPDRGVGRALELLANAGVHAGSILLLTDGASADLLPVAREVRQAGHRLSILGAGTPAGAPIPRPEGGVVRDVAGDPVVPGLGEAGLREAARAGGGDYHRLTLDTRDLDALLADGPAAGDRTGSGTAREDLGYWLLLPLLVLVPLAFRRGWLGSVALVAVLVQPEPGMAAGWKNADQEGLAHLEAGRFEQAAETFRDPHWQAVARYRAGDYRAAADLLAGIDTARAHYNRGNALARLGKARQAIAAYDRALAIEPGHADARHNRALVQKRLENRRQSGEPPEDAAGDPQSGESGQDSAEQAGRGGDQGQQGSAGPPEEGEPQGESPEDGQPAEAGEGSQPDAANEGPARSRQGPAADGERWLQRVPDDPGSLLRRKFEYQYGRRGPANGEDPW